MRASRLILPAALLLCLMGLLFSFACAEGSLCIDDVPHELGETKITETPATCDNPGTHHTEYVCANCHNVYETKDETMPALGHSWGEWTMTKAASCVEDGEERRICGRDASHIETRAIEKTAHTPGEAVRENEIAATCETDGSYAMVVRCANCSAELSRDTVVVSALGHSWGEWTITKAASCTEEGEERRVCARDAGHAETREIEKAAHTPGDPVRENVTPATCEAKGDYESVVYCEVCGVELSREKKTLSAKGHTSSITTRRISPATCETGEVHEKTEACSVCGKVLSTTRQEETPPGHVLVYISRIPPRENRPGMLSHFKCMNCHELFRSQNDTVPVREEELSFMNWNGDAMARNIGALMINGGRVAQNIGIIEENYGIIESNEGTVNHQFYNVTSKMDAGDYSVKFDDSFRCVEDGDKNLGMYLEAGRSGVFILNAPRGSRITGVSYTLNGQELELEDLGDGKYRLTAPGMPEGADGFAFNEGNLRVRVEEDPDAVEDESWKSSQLRSLEQQDASINLLKVMDRDAGMNSAANRAIRVEGMDFSAADEEFRRQLASRTDIMNAIADAAYGDGKGTMIFVLDNGARIICDVARVHNIIVELMPKVQYKDEPEGLDDSFFQELQAYEDKLVSTGIITDNSDIRITMVFKDNEDRETLAEATPKPPEPEKYNEAPEDDDDGGKGCLTPETLIMLSDGSEKRVDELDESDRLLVWNFDLGCLAEAPMTFFHVVKEEAPVLRVSFSDGTSVGIVAEHVFFDMTDRKFVAINRAEQQEKLAGHSFARFADGRITEVELTGIQEDGVAEGYYSPVSQEHFNCFANGMLNMSGFMGGLYNVFELEADELKYNAEKKAAEIEIVGELPYELFGGLFSRELYESNNVGWLSVPVAKRMIHLRDMYELFDFCVPYFVEPGAAD